MSQPARRNENGLEAGVRATGKKPKRYRRPFPIFRNKKKSGRSPGRPSNGYFVESRESRLYNL